MGVAARNSSPAWLGGPAREPWGAQTVSLPAQQTEEPDGASVVAGPDRVLLVAVAFQLPYRVLRCAHAAKAEVYVLGNSGATALRRSRYCERFVASESIISGERDEALALEINCLVREYGISMVVPGDAASTRTLIASRDLIEAPCFPLPTLEMFDLLNNKWAFAGLCRQLAIRHPETSLMPDAAELAQAVQARGAERAWVAKPLNRSGGVGFVRFDGTDTERRLRSINYRPILVQEFVQGVDIGASVYASGGEIEAFIAHRYHRRIYQAFPHHQVQSDIGRIVEHCKLTGVYNFDMILAPNGSIYYLECNPRFFYKINLSMIAGINFVERGLPRTSRRSEAMQQRSSIKAAVQVRYPEALLLSLLHSRPTRRDWRMAGHLYSDPWPYLIEKLKLTV
jgi:hypothetical protein